MINRHKIIQIKYHSKTTILYLIICICIHIHKYKKQTPAPSTNIEGESYSDMFTRLALKVPFGHVGKLFLSNYVEGKIGNIFEGIIEYQTGSKLTAKVVRFLAKPELKSAAESISYVIGAEAIEAGYYVTSLAKTLYKDPQNYKGIFWDTTKGVTRFAINGVGTLVSDRVGPTLVRKAAVTAVSTTVSLIAGPAVSYTAGLLTNQALKDTGTDKYVASFVGAHTFPLITATLSYGAKTLNALASTTATGIASAASYAGQALETTGISETVSGYATT